MARAAQHYEDSAGRQIHGLGRRPDKMVEKNGKNVTVPGRFYAIAQRNKTFGRDPIQAIRKFRLWEARESKSTIDLIDGFVRTGPLRNPDGTWPTALRTHKIPEEVYWSQLRDMLIETPKLIAEKTGIEQVGYLDDLQPPSPSLKLDQVSDLYQQKKNCGTKEKRQGLTNWTEFVRIMRKVDQVKTIRDITLEHVEHYHEWLHKQIDKGKYSPKYANMKMGKVRTMLRYALKRSSDKEQLRRVIDLTELFESARNTNGQVKAITVEDYQAILKACRQVKSVDGDLWYALILFSLNMCATGRDFECCLPHHLDLEKGTVVYPRPKTGIMRVGVLWDRTVKAIRTYQEKHPHGLDVVFANWDYRKKRYSPIHALTTVPRQFRKIADQAGLKVDLKMIRKGGYSAAIEGGCDTTHAEILMGHKAKGSAVTDHYLERNPKMVADACEAIETHYFGK